jgi:ribosomal-protein-alanine N-acetyltransferase
LASTLTCRQINPSDDKGLSSLYKETDGPSLSFLRSLSDKPSGASWCALSGDQLIAAVWLNVFGDEAEIIDFRVDARMRQQGVGRYLLSEILNVLDLSGIKAVFLEVRRSNLAAITLYERAGFATIGVRNNYYETAKGREDALLMRHDSNKR